MVAGVTLDRRVDEDRRHRDRRSGPLAADESEVFSVRLPIELAKRLRLLCDQEALKPSEFVRAVLEREVRTRLRRPM